MLSKRRPVKISLKINTLKLNALMINISSKLINALKMTAVNLNAHGAEVTPHTLNEYKTYADVQITLKILVLSMLKSAI